MSALKETHLRYDGELFAEEGERADSLFESCMNQNVGVFAQDLRTTASMGCCQAERRIWLVFSLLSLSLSLFLSLSLSHTLSLTLTLTHATSQLAA